MAIKAMFFPALEDKGNPLRENWDRLKGTAAGRWLFNQLLRVVVPYTGSLGARVEEVRPGYARVVLEERFAVRNHLRSVHAIALANLVELTGNVAVVYACPDDARMIVAGMRMKYLKKARGKLTATAHPPVPTSNERQQFEVVVEVRDEGGDLVCEGTLETLVGPKK